MLRIGTPLRLPVTCTLHISMMSAFVIPLEVQRTSPSTPFTTPPFGSGSLFDLATSDSVFVMVRVMLRVRVRLRVRLRVITQGSVWIMCMVIHRDTCMALACAATAAVTTFGFLFTALPVFLVPALVGLLPLLALGGLARACASARFARTRGASST